MVCKMDGVRFGRRQAVCEYKRSNSRMIDYEAPTERCAQLYDQAKASTGERLDVREHVCVWGGWGRLIWWCVASCGDGSSGTFTFH